MQFGDDCRERALALLEKDSGVPVNRIARAWLGLAILEDQLDLWAVQIDKESRYVPRCNLLPGKIVAISKADIANEYMNYAEHCLKTAQVLRRQKDRVIQREMAAEWVRLVQLMVEDASLGAGDQSNNRKTEAGS
jgi:hypothetical protein